MAENITNISNNFFNDIKILRKKNPVSDFQVNFVFMDNVV